MVNVKYKASSTLYRTLHTIETLISCVPLFLQVSWSLSSWWSSPQLAHQVNSRGWVNIHQSYSPTHKRYSVNSTRFGTLQNSSERLNSLTWVGLEDLFVQPKGQWVVWEDPSSELVTTSSVVPRVGQTCESSSPIHVSVFFVNAYIIKFGS